MEKSKPSPQTIRHYLAAVVLGTALAALGPTEQLAASEISGQAINDISRYCAACWRNAHLPMDRWNDCTQEVFRRLLERLDPKGWSHVLASESEERKEFLRAIDTVKKRTQRERRGSPLVSEAVADPKGQQRDGYGDQRDAVRQAAQELLSPRQQRILQMTCEGWSIPDMAGELALAPERISDEKYKAVQKLRSFFQGHPEGRG